MKQWQKRVLITGAALGVVAVTAAPAGADVSSVMLRTQAAYDQKLVQVCQGSTVTQSFKAWGDTNYYTPITNGGFENGLTNWVVEGGKATVVSGNQNLLAVPGSGSKSLKLGAQAAVSSTPFCIRDSAPVFRVFLRNTSAYVQSVLVMAVSYSGNGLYSFGMTAVTVPAGGAWIAPLASFRAAYADCAGTISTVAIQNVGTSDIYVDDFQIDPLRLR